MCSFMLGLKTAIVGEKIFNTNHVADIVRGTTRQVQNFGFEMSGMESFFSYRISYGVVFLVLIAIRTTANTLRNQECPR